MPLRFILVVAGTLALVKATTALWSVPASTTPQGPTDQPDCTYNGVVQSCVVTLSEDSSATTDNTVLIHWLDGETTSVWFLSNGSTDAGAKVILNHNKRGRITRAVPLENGYQRLHVKSETGNQLSFVLPPVTDLPLPGTDVAG